MTNCGLSRLTGRRQSGPGIMFRRCFQPAEQGIVGLVAIRGVRGRPQRRAFQGALVRVRYKTIAARRHAFRHRLYIGRGAGAVADRRGLYFRRFLTAPNEFAPSHPILPIQRRLGNDHGNMSRDKKERREQEGANDQACDSQSAHVPAPGSDHESFLDRHR